MCMSNDLLWNDLTFKIISDLWLALKVLRLWPYRRRRPWHVIFCWNNTSHNVISWNVDVEDNIFIPIINTFQSDVNFVSKRGHRYCYSHSVTEHLLKYYVFISLNDRPIQCTMIPTQFFIIWPNLCKIILFVMSSNMHCV